MEAKSNHPSLSLIFIFSSYVVIIMGKNLTKTQIENNVEEQLNTSISLALKSSWRTDWRADIAVY